ncbi:hypothetical protein GN956_G5095 [Arapaima gigas]
MQGKQSLRGQRPGGCTEFQSKAATPSPLSQRAGARASGERRFAGFHTESSRKLKTPLTCTHCDPPRTSLRSSSNDVAWRCEPRGASGRIFSCEERG